MFKAYIEWRSILLPILTVFAVQLTFAQEDKNARFSILGGPGYTPDYGFLVGGSALTTFDFRGMEGVEKRSVLPVAFSLSFGRGVDASIVVRPQLFIAQDRIRVMGEFLYSNLSSNYYGVGYNQNSSIERGDETTSYFYSQINFNPIVMFRMGQSDWFLGANLHAQYDKITYPAQGVTEDANYIKAGGDESGLNMLNNGVGFSLNYDSRDIPANAYSGLFFDIRALAYGDYFGGEYNYQLLKIDYRQYVQLSSQKSGRTLAWSLSSENTFGDVPFTRLSTVGSPFDLRGYYQGQYRDKTTHMAMVEYRHKFHVEPVDMWSKLANRFGFVAWVGSGFIGPSPFEIEGVLPNYGVGLRVEVQPRMNFRVEMGRSPIEGQTLFYFNMTEAF
ncbi:MAG: BamA/TamA family outer membrane protein [Rikenellaceae bacterium]